MLSGGLIGKCMEGFRIENDGYEAEINLSGKSYKLFLQPGFFCATKYAAVPHLHKYCELHCVIRGEGEYSVGNERISISRGSVVVIPGGVFHGYLSRSDDLKLCRFQVAGLKSGLRLVQVNEGLLDALGAAVERYTPDADFTEVGAYIGAVLAAVGERANSVPKQITDREFLTHEFFTDCSRDMNISELSRVLNLSSKQAQRTIKRVTGLSFRDELAYRRITAARELLKDDSVSLAEAGERVGYKTYSGFWRAYTKIAGVRQKSHTAESEDNKKEV